MIRKATASTGFLHMKVLFVSIFFCIWLSLQQAYVEIVCNPVALRFDVKKQVAVCQVAERNTVETTFYRIMSDFNWAVLFVLIIRLGTVY
jgi:hypothetical protein